MNNYFLRKSEVSVERISVYYVIEELAEHGIYCLPCCDINNVIDLLSKECRVYIGQNDVSWTSLYQGKWAFNSCYCNRCMTPLVSVFAMLPAKIK